MPTYRPWVIFKHKNIKFVKYIDDDDDNDDDDDDDDDDELLDIISIDSLIFRAL